MILMSYDGSADAQAALEHTAALMPGAETVVFTAWEPYLDMLEHTGSMGIGFGMASGYGDSEAIDANSQSAALATATEGTERAKAAGLAARPLTAGRHGGAVEAILASADELDADVIVVGTRGRSAVRSFLLGSVSHGLVQHADRSVLVVPSPAFAGERRRILSETSTEHA